MTAEARAHKKRLWAVMWLNEVALCHAATGEMFRHLLSDATLALAEAVEDGAVGEWN